MRLFTLSMLSLIIVSLGSGCGPAAPPPAGKPKAESAGEHKHDHEAEHAHDHGTEGPHGGTLAEWGAGNFHVEFKADHAKKEATVYILGEDAKSAAPVKADKVSLSLNDPQVQFDLLPQPLTGETDGKSSRFVGVHEAIGKEQEFSGTIGAEVDGTPYAGDFKETADAHDHDHDHAHEKKK